MLRHDIVVAIAAGNAGPSSLTIGNPAAALGSLNVGAASLPHNERILRRAQFGPVVGALYRPFLGVQSSYFSSRGPNADGRVDPDVTANGFASYGQGFSSAIIGITIGSGTSFATPSVAGVAAVLRQRFPAATAAQVRNAIIMSANPSVLTDGSTYLDQGKGYVDAVAAAALLLSGTVPNVIPVAGTFGTSVKVNIESGTFLNVRDGFVTQHFSNLKPGQRFEIPYRVSANTRQVVVSLSGVSPALPPAQQNQLFGDDILLTVHTAKTSSIGEGDYPVFEFATGGTFAVSNPESGVLRVTVNGDWTNAGTISGDIAIFSPPSLSHSSRVRARSIMVKAGFPSQHPCRHFSSGISPGLAGGLGQLSNWRFGSVFVNPSGSLNVDGRPSTTLRKFAKQSSFWTMAGPSRWF
jgi:hypothetical protein